MTHDALARLAALSARVGSDITRVQGGGGNTSLKQAGQLHVKASGTWLANALQQDLFVALDLAAVHEAMRFDDCEARIAAMAPPGGLRASIETTLHALMPQACVLHVHAVDAIATDVQPDADARFESALRGLRWARVPYARPGAPLTAAVAACLQSSADAPDVLLLANHGLLVAADDCDAAERLLDEVCSRLALAPRAPGAFDAEALQQANDLGWQIPQDPRLHALATDPRALEVARGAALYPDHVVFLGGLTPVLGPGMRLSTMVDDAAPVGPSPVWALVAGAGVLVSPRLGSGGLAMLQCLAEVALRIDDTSGLRRLTPCDVAALAGWDAEAYRRTLQPDPIPVPA